MISGDPQDQVFQALSRWVCLKYQRSSGYLARRSRSVRSKMATARIGFAVPPRMRKRDLVDHLVGTGEEGGRNG